MQKILKSLKKIALKIGYFQTMVLLILFYFLAIGLVFLILKVLRKDLLSKKFKNKPSFWIEKKEREISLEEASHQF